MSHYGKKYKYHGFFFLFVYTIIKNPVLNENHRPFKLLFCHYRLGIYLQNTGNTPPVMDEHNNSTLWLILTFFNLI